MTMMTHRLGFTLMTLLVVLVMVGVPVVVLAEPIGPTHDGGDSAVRTEARQTYKAEAVYEFTTQASDSVNEEHIDSTLEPRFNSCYARFQRREVQDRVIARYRAKHPDCAIAIQTLRDIFESGFKMELLPRSRLVRTTIAAEDPTLAANLANAYVEVCEEVLVEQNKALAETAVAFLTAILAEEEQRLAKIEKALLETCDPQRMETLAHECDISVGKIDDLHARRRAVSRKVAEKALAIRVVREAAPPDSVH